MMKLMILFFGGLIATSKGFDENDDYQDPIRHPLHQENTVVIVLLVRNKAHSLPYFLFYLDKLRYPKHRISLWIRSDHNRDTSGDILKKWLEKQEDLYHNLDIHVDTHQQEYQDQTGDCDWSPDRFGHVIALRQQALMYARKSWADYIFFVDVDVMLTNPLVLQHLISQHRTVVAPMLNVTSSEWYSNFWGDMDEEGYYKRSDEYEPILRRHWEGCFQVANVHTAFLIDLRHKDSRHLGFYPPPPGYSGPLDDVLLFAHIAQVHDVSLHVLNTHVFGYVPVPMQAHNTLSHEAEQFTHIKIEAIIYDEPLEKLPYIELPEELKDKLGFDEVYMVNLLRRPDRRDKMLAVFDELGVDAHIVDAVDGQMLNESFLQKIGVKMLDGYADPYQDRPLTMGEIGCFLSHHYIWTEVVDRGHSVVAVFEDDLRFEPYFRTKLERVMDELAEQHVDWDLVYLGRKRLNAREETWLSDSLVWPHYSYWTLSYLLSQAGATKLLAQQPLTKLIPVDEFLPVMFDRHPEAAWKEAFGPRDLVALSVQPLLIYPTHYTGEPGYVTDTEDSQLLASHVPQHGGREPHLSGAHEEDAHSHSKRGDIDSQRDEL